MKVLFNTEKLQRLVENLQILTGIKTGIWDGEGRNVQIFCDRKEFCRLIHAEAEGHQRCEACNSQAIRACTNQQGIYRYRCHAGLWEVVLPLFEKGVPIAFLSFGQFLDETPLERQWDRTEKVLGWYQGDRKTLREAFWSLRQFTFRETSACAELMQALSAYILKEGLIRCVEYTDLQRLEMYLDDHFRENLSLAKIASDLHMGTTKLSKLARQLPGSPSVSQAITSHRMEEARAMLLQDDTPVSAVAAAVGYNDYNYFTKIFKAQNGSSPSVWRKANRR